MKQAIRNTRHAGLLITILLLVVLSGCTVRRSQLPLPIPSNSKKFSKSGVADLSSRWWEAFGENQINRLVDQSLVQNFSLKSSFYRVKAARALARRTQSALYPQLDNVLGLQSNAGPGPNRYNLSIGLDVSYQVDLWGELESRAEADLFRADSSEEDLQTVSLILSGDVVRAWLSLIEANAQVRLLQKQIEVNQQGLQLQRSRFGLGLIRSPDVLRQSQLLEGTFEQLAIAKGNVQVLKNQLAVLLGQDPVTAKYDVGGDLPKLPLLPRTGVPLDLLSRRPDIRRDFLALKAADRDLASAISSRYPRLNLTGSLTNPTSTSGDFLRDWFVSVAGQLIQPVLDGGRRQADVDQASARKCELLNQLAHTTLVAFQEVEDRLILEETQSERIRRLDNQLRLSNQASEQLMEQYIVGDASYLDVLNTIATQQNLQRQILSARLDRLLTRVSLYLALAGRIEPDEQAEAFTPLPLEESEPETGVVPAESNL